MASDGEVLRWQVAGEELTVQYRVHIRNQVKWVAV